MFEEPSELSGAIKSNWNNILHHCVPEVCIPLTTCRLWLEILPWGMSQRGTEHSLSLLNTSFTNFSESFCYLFWRTHTLFNSKDVKIEKKSRSVLFATTAKSIQLCPTLCDPIDSSPPGSLIPGILQARTLEWVAISFSNAWEWKVKVKSLRHVRLLATPWTAVYQAPPSMGFSRQEYWSGLPLPSPKSHAESRKSECKLSSLKTWRGHVKKDKSQVEGTHMN